MCCNVFCNQKHLDSIAILKKKFSFLIAFAFLIFPALSQAQLDNNFAGGGGIKIGDSTTTCTGNAGALRYDLDSSDGGGLQYCDGTTWTGILPSSFAGVVNNGNSFAAPMIIGTNDANSLALETNGTTRITIDTSGNVGIGTSIPFRPLTVQGDIVSSTGVYTAVMKADAGLGGAVLGADSNHPVLFYSNSIEHVRITPSGNVGIGTTAPLAELDVSGTGALVVPRGTSLEQPGTPANGMIRYNTDNNKFEAYENSAWTNMIGSGGGSGDFLADGSVPMTGAFLATSGTNAAPGISFNGDTNTGIYRPSADKLGFATNGAQRLVIDSSGYISAGGGTQNVSPIGVLTSDTTTYSPTGASFPVPVSQASNYIGNSSLTDGVAALDYYHVINSSFDAQYGYIGTVSESSGKTPSIVFGQSTGMMSYAERLRIDASGNVGVGTSTPGSILDVNGAETMRGMAAPGLSSAGQGRIYFDSTANKFKVSENGGAYANLISSGGSGDFLADGTVAMTGALQLADGASSTPGLTFASNTDTGIFLSSTNRMNITTDGTPNFTFASGYFQGNGTNGSVKLLRDIGSAATPSYSFKSWSAMGMFASADNELSFSTSGTEALRIDASSQVGIGSSTPKATLDVNGDVKIGNSSATCSATTAGSIRYNSGSLEYCDGATWQVVGGGLVGKVSMDGASNCEWYVSSTSWTTPSVDADCNAQTLTGSALAPTEGKIPAIRFTNLPAGDYELVLNLNMFTNNASDTCHFILYDGTSRSGYAYTYYGDQNNLIGQFSYSTTQSDITFYVQAKRGGSNGCWLDNSAGQKFEIWLKKI